MTPIARAVAAVAGTPAAMMFPLPLRTEYIDGRTWRVIADFFFHSPAPDVFPSIGVPAGFETDFASVPRVFWIGLSPTDERIGRIAVIHDRYYHAPWIAITREHADMALRAGMEALGSPLWERSVCYALIRAFGRGFLPRES